MLPLLSLLQVALQLACFHTWRHQSTHDDMQLLLTSRQLLVAEGDIPFIGYSVMHYVSRALFSSDNLVTSLEARHSDLELVKSTQAPDMIRFLEAHLCTTCELIGYVLSRSLACLLAVFTTPLSSRIPQARSAAVLESRHYSTIPRAKVVAHRLLPGA